LAYLEHFGPSARAVIQRKGAHLVLRRGHSKELFRLLLTADSDFRRRLLLFGIKVAMSLPSSKASPGAIYLNVGHTGLDEPSLPAWIARHRLRAIYLVHDLIPITHPETCRLGEDQKHERRMRNVLTSATVVIANSEATANELAGLASRLGLSMPSTVVAWLSGDALRRSAMPATLGRPYFLVLGTIEGRKNHQLLLEVWQGLVERLGEGAPKLVIVGSRGWQAEDVFRQLDSLGPLQSHVEERSNCSDEELAQLMAGARALLMPSLAEGYGLPVFEALELGTPVIAADLPVYHEVAGSIPVYLPLDDPASWEQAVIDYMADEPQRASQIERMRGFKVPDWRTHFATVEHWLARPVD
jgi:glycosyltransferase involved in cell wall biosynthesis